MGCHGSKPGCIAPRAGIYQSELPADIDQAAIKAIIPNDFHKEYTLGRKLGEGSFGSVYSARHATSALEVAVKVIDPHSKDEEGRRGDGIDKKMQRAAAREVAMLQALPRSPNVMQFHGLYASGDLAYMVLEKCGMKLLQCLERMPALTEAAMRPLFKDMLCGIAACHNSGIAHRDIKPDNFMVSPASGIPGFAVKLCDFGLASKVSSPTARELRGVFGTPPFMAPEMLDDQAYSSSVDVWAFGVLAYVLLYGMWPYTPAILTGQAMKVAIQLGSPAPRFRGRVGLSIITETCTGWVQALLRRNPADRPSAEQALKHRNFNKPWCNKASLVTTLAAAKRVGAFELPGRVVQSPSDLDKLLVRLNAEGRGGPMASSEVSTDVGSDSPAPR